MIRIERLDGHDRSQFDCGVDELNEWLRTQASQQQRRGNAVTFVAVHRDDGRVIGYYSSLTYRLDLAEAEAAYGRGTRRYPVPALLLARLAVSRRHHGEGVGAELLVHALRTAAEVADKVGVEILVVHAIDSNAAAFYRHFGFTPFVDHELRLFMPIATIRKTLE